MVVVIIRQALGTVYCPPYIIVKLALSHISLLSLLYAKLQGLNKSDVILGQLGMTMARQELHLFILS